MVGGTTPLVATPRGTPAAAQTVMGAVPPGLGCVGSVTWAEALNPARKKQTKALE